MRIAIIAESFPPDVNGVAHSVVRIAEHLVRRGHTPLVIAPAPSSSTRGLTGVHPFPVIRVPSMPLPRYRSLRLGLPGPKLTEALVSHAPDMVHLACPFLLGARGVALAQQRRMPCLAVYQTDVAAYARTYVGWGEAAVWKWMRTIHNGADRTLAPSTRSAADLVAHGIQRVWLWQRGVDTVRFDPAKRNDLVRKALAPNGEVLVGYVGRLAAEKRVDLLAKTSELPGVRVVIVGDGPARRDLEKALPTAVFLGARHGGQLARLFASFDIFAHTGPHETFGQTIQEALASGLPVVAPSAGGPLDLVTPGVNGTLVPPEDADALAGAVAELATDGELRRQYGTNARSGVEGRTWSAVGDELIAHYESILASPGVTRHVRVAA
ncbi:glycosyltransferase family 1 protein [Phytohabitans sp. ZYX-F-186]|uniref:Glycosyltransferase family 1 protein n=1 Tax=Phytohabitans maris TaxID=3071409 RepID=A0ABU0ZE67_9ACTN|nr:glycosyltransferase family 1 protein [Phytohabitans sp. ZYX-F-186]MDQ7904731.1 glycosyltransferase family 1 protein [Phytohabitans sp. ZYX-F-186]